MKALAQRYARALVDVAIERRKSEALRQQLDAFAAVVAESADLRSLLANPAVSRESKHALIGKVVERLGGSPELRNFLCVLVDNRRVLLVPQIREAFQVQLHQRLGVAEVQVTSARELSASEKAELTKALEQVTGKRVEARYELEPNLIGGAVVRIGSTVYDGSVRQQLNRLRTSLAQE